MTRSAEALARDRELANARQRAYNARKLLERPPVDELSVTCWCETTVVRVPRALVLDGRTETCGRSTCAPPRARGAA